MNWAIFDLPAVVDYNHLPLRQCLISSIQEMLGEKANMREVDWSGNCSGVLLDIFQDSVGRFPKDEEYEQIKSGFHACLIQYFKHTEENFDIQPGIQSIFDKLDKKKDWEYLILSDYWEDDTKFILSSCGMYTKRKRIYSSDDALNAFDLMTHAVSANKIDKDGNVVYLFSERYKRKHLKLKKVRKLYKVLPPSSLKSKFESYPKFSKVFSH